MDGMLTRSTKCWKCLNDRKGCEGGMMEAKVAEAPTPSQVSVASSSSFGRRRLPTQKAKAADSGLLQMQVDKVPLKVVILPLQVSRKRSMLAQPVENAPPVLKLARTSQFSIAVCHWPSISSGLSLQVPDNISVIS